MMIVVEPNGRRMPSYDPAILCPMVSPRISSKISPGMLCPAISSPKILSPEILAVGEKRISSSDSPQLLKVLSLKTGVGENIVFCASAIARN